MKQLHFFVERHLLDDQISPLIRREIFVFPWAYGPGIYGLSELRVDWSRGGKKEERQ
ncbi:hypothetical protein BZL30_5225 [Mycobacterium kansasii]|uniref:Uncharacterized protein n=1 Tax=Mycobacterium kansasii TaxID=1768 RepID=A0A1V3X3Q5_MYCKA|nr:hypothetical protein MKSMC1_30150 [Mycobacterium kansasii]OOK73904.1 hypothetical protein BZL30_5225 [Mycobacterium kansasii]